MAHDRPALWRGTHNSYVQVSSELGIPGFVLYMAVLVSCFQITGSVLRRTRGRPESKRLASAALAVRFSLISYCVTSFFLTHAYTAYVPTLAALCYALRAWADRELPAAVAAVPVLAGLPAHRKRELPVRSGTPKPVTSWTSSMRGL